MQFRFHCLLLRHVSDRVTVWPLEHTSLAVHAREESAAREDLVLALDDKLTRVHPRSLASYARAGSGEALTLAPQSLRVWSAHKAESRPLLMTALWSQAQKPFFEVRVPRAHLRLWLEGDKELVARAQPLLAERLRGLSDSELLDLRREGDEEFFELVVEAEPVDLRQLRQSDLGREVMPLRDPEERAEERASKDDEWFYDLEREQKKRLQRARGQQKKRPPTPTLDRLGTPWHKLARRGRLDTAFERDAVVLSILERLERPRAEPLVLLGEAGAGKSTILQALALYCARKEGPAERRQRPLFYLDGSRLIAGQGGFGMWQEQVNRVVAEARAAGAWLVLGHLVELLDAGRSAHSDGNVAQVLTPLLGSREVLAIAEATPEEWARVGQRNEGFAAVWSVLRVESPDGPTTERIAQQVAVDLGRRRKVHVEPAAVTWSVTLARRFRPYGSLVGNAVSFLRRLLEARAHSGASEVRASDALALFSSETGIPEVLLRDDLPLDLAEVRRFLATRVHAQPHAVARAAEVVGVLKTALTDQRRPVAVLFFAGPTGVGKTELSKALAAYLFGSSERLVRLDMGEYAGFDAADRLLGASDGPGSLAAAVRRQPFCVVLLDEIEKAHPEVFDVLLGVLGDGRLTDSRGRFTDFRNAVIVMTSNLGADTLRARVGFGAEAAVELEARRHYIAEAERFFRPELFNRIDDFVVFSALGREAIATIVQRELELVSNRDGLRTHDVQLVVESEAQAQLAARGVDPRYGARPLKRTLERELVAPLATWLSEHPLAGPTRLTVELRDGRFALSAQQRNAQHGVTRQSVQQLLDAASDQRAEVRQWARSRAALALKRQVELYEQLSRQPSFWKEPALAQSSTHRATEGRALLDDFTSVTRGVEAVEDLAMEAYYLRSASALEGLRGELTTLEERFSPLKMRLFRMLYPARKAALVVLSCGRNGWPYLRLLATALRDWGSSVEGLELSLVRSCLWIPEESRTTPQARAAKDWFEWVEGWREPDPGPRGGMALLFRGSPEVCLLMAEHGVHRFLQQGSTAAVRVQVQLRSDGDERIPEANDLPQPGDDAEVRRYLYGKGRAEDLQTGAVVPFSESAFSLEALQEAFLRWRVFGPEAEPWT